MDALVIHSIRDANHCFKNELYKGKKLYTTHPSVEVYLEERHSLECHCILADFGKTELSDLKNKAKEFSEQLICQIEEPVDAWLNQLTGKQKNYFRSLYEEVLPGHVASLLLLERWLDNNLVSCDEWLFYAHDLNGFLQTKQDLFIWLKNRFLEANLLVLDYPGRLAVGNDFGQTYFSGFTLEEIADQYRQGQKPNPDFHYEVKIDHWPEAAFCYSLLDYVSEDLRQSFVRDCADIVARDFDENFRCKDLKVKQKVDKKSKKDRNKTSYVFLPITSVFESFDGIDGYELLQEQLEMMRKVDKISTNRKENLVQLPHDPNRGNCPLLKKLQQINGIRVIV